MRALKKRLFVVAIIGISVCAVSRASSWLTEGGDSERTGWQRDDAALTTANVSRMKLLWKTQLASDPRQMHELFPPLIISGVTTAKGAKELAVFASIANDLFAVDVTTGRLFWTAHLVTTPQPSGPGNVFCPGGQTAAPVAVPGSTSGSYIIYALGQDGQLYQVNAADGEALAAPIKWLPPNGKPYALNQFHGVLYTSLAQGCGNLPYGFYSLDPKTQIASGFLPKGGGLWGRRGVAIDSDGRVYMGTGDGPFDPERKELGNSIVAVKLDQDEELQLVDYFAPPNATWLFHRDIDINVSPVLFDYHGKHFLVDSSKECRVWLLDRDNLGGSDHRTSLYTTPLICNDVAANASAGVWGALATWRDAHDTQWVYVPFWGPVSDSFHAPIGDSRPAEGGVAAFKLQEDGSQWRLAPAWLSESIEAADEVIVCNGIVFVDSSGEDMYFGRPETPWNEPPPSIPVLPPNQQSSAMRIAGSTHATLYALDAATGKVLWSSGDQIKSWNHWSGISVADGRVYIPTYDGNVYCFGTDDQQSMNQHSGD